MAYLRDWCLHNLGYLNTIKVKDFILMLTGILIGIITTILLTSRFLCKIEKSPNLGKISSAKIQYKGRYHYFINVSNFYQGVEVLVSILFLPFLYKNQYILESKRRNRIFLLLIMILFCILFVTSILFISNPIVLTTSITFTKRVPPL